MNIVDVKLSSDLLNAKVYFRVLDKSNLQIKKFMKSLPPMIRYELATSIDLKRIPKLTFMLDTSIENANHIEDLLNLNDRWNPFSK